MRVGRDRRVSDPVRAAAPVCASPEVHLFFRPDGEVRTCCINDEPLGFVPRDRLADIWQGTARSALVASIAAGRFDRGCGACGAEIEAEGRDGSMAASFDWLAPGDGPPAVWPALLTFNLSIDCNLQCVQCDGEQSSSIRLHREHRPPMAPAYGDAFFTEIVPFLAHARRADFSGGEPFMARENYRIWDLIPSVAPDLECRVVTNGTQWNSRVESVLERVPLGFVFSIDGITAATYESIRIGASFDSVMANMDRFLAVARERGTWASVNHCLMPENVHEFAELLLWAESRDLPVEVSVVRKPSAHSIAALPHEAIVAIVDELDRQSPTVLPQLRRNAHTWNAELARLRSWAKADAATRRSLAGFGTQTVAGLPRRGSGPYDDVAARADLAASPALRGSVHSVDVDEHGTIVDGSASVTEVGFDVDRLVGSPVDQLPERLQERFGPLARQRVVRSDGDRIDTELTFASATIRSSVVALRDAGGFASVARILFAVETT